MIHLVPFIVHRKLVARRLAAHRLAAHRLAAHRFVVPSLALLMLSAGAAHAFAPSSQTIFGRMARAGGKGIYAIEQEVQFHTEADPVVLRERWIVENGETMRLSVNGIKGSHDNWRFDAVYRDGKKIWSDGAQIRTSGASAEFIEPVLHFRSSASLLSWLTRANVVPQGLGQPRRFNRKTNPYSPEAGVRLGRTGGVVAWVFGEPSAPQGALTPGLWVEQDAFQMRRMRFPSQAEVEADRYATFAAGLRLPRERTVTWDASSVSIRLLTVKSLPASSNPQSLLSPTTLNGADGRPTPSRLPESSQVREFYSRFR